MNNKLSKLSILLTPSEVHLVQKWLVEAAPEEITIEEITTEEIAAGNP
jgi:hypothetical protein